jgi:transcriptional regulator with XRE-family HTH domain
MIEKERIRKERLRIGLNILIRRRELNMTQSELAEAAGVSRNQISSIERGKTNFGMEALFAIAEALGVEYQELLK